MNLKFRLQTVSRLAKASVMYDSSGIEYNVRDHDCYAWRYNEVTLRFLLLVSYFIHHIWYFSLSKALNVPGGHTTQW